MEIHVVTKVFFRAWSVQVLNDLRGKCEVSILQILGYRSPASSWLYDFLGILDPTV